MRKTEVVELKNVTKSYQLGEHKLKVLDDISLTICGGEFVSIMGPSGSGKSTLMHIIGLLDTPTSGTVLFEGENVSKLPEEKLAQIRNKKIGFVFQQFNLLERTSAVENVALPLMYSNTSQNMYDRAKVELARVGLSDRLSHYPSQLSGGQQQRVAVARALVTSPALILADEPTGNLDTKSGKEVIKILRDLNREGKTVVIVTHEASVAVLAHRVIRIKDGSLLKSSKRSKSIN